MTQCVRFALWSPENELARPKAASFRFPLLSIKRLEPASIEVAKMSCWLHKYFKSNKDDRKLRITFDVTMKYLINMTIMKPRQQQPHKALLRKSVYKFSNSQLN